MAGQELIDIPDNPVLRIPDCKELPAAYNPIPGSRVLHTLDYMDSSGARNTPGIFGHSDSRGTPDIVYVRDIPVC